MADTWGCLGITKRGKPCSFGSKCKRKHPSYVRPGDNRSPEQCQGLTVRGKRCRIAMVSCPYHGDRAVSSRQVDEIEDAHASSDDATLLSHSEGGLKAKNPQKRLPRKAHRTDGNAERHNKPEREEPRYIVTRLMTFRPETSGNARRITAADKRKGGEIKASYETDQSKECRLETEHALLPEEDPMVEELPQPSCHDRSHPVALPQMKIALPATASEGRRISQASTRSPRSAPPEKELQTPFSGNRRTSDTPNEGFSAIVGDPEKSLERVKEATGLPRDSNCPIDSTEKMSSLMFQAHRSLGSVAIVPSSAEKLNRMLTLFAKGRESQATPIDALRRLHSGAQGTEACRNPGEKDDEVKEAAPLLMMKRQDSTKAPTTSSLGSVKGITRRTERSEAVIDRTASQAVRVVWNFLYEGLLFWSGQLTHR